ncbi:DNA damage-inducible transcript 3 protein [Rhinophrynus dorsalis]
MMAESLPFGGSTGTLSGWELEAWYEDLQDILWSDTKELGSLQSGSDQSVLQVETLDSSPYFWTLESLDYLPVDITEEDSTTLEAAVEQLPPGVLELLNLDTPETSVSSSCPETEKAQQLIVAPEPDPYCSSSSVNTHTDDEESCASPSGTKRKRSRQPHGGKLRVKEREQENERKVDYLIAENERLKGEIERLSMEVEKTRKALIDRMVNLKKV